MLREEDKIEDNLYDDISPVLYSLNVRRTWGAEKHNLFIKLEKLLDSERYKGFTGDCRSYHMTRMGQACLYDIPTDQRGFLRRYRDKRVRLVCMGGWNAYTGRFYRVAAVPRNELPSEIQKFERPSGRTFGGRW